MANISYVDASIPKIKSVHFGKSGEEDPEGRVWNRCEKTDAKKSRLPLSGTNSQQL